MRMHYIIRGIAGTFVIASLALGYLHSPGGTCSPLSSG